MQSSRALTVQPVEFPNVSSLHGLGDRIVGEVTFFLRPEDSSGAENPLAGERLGWAKSLLWMGLAIVIPVVLGRLG